MAEKQQVIGEVAEILKCPLCLGTITEPSTLLCFHNFCTPCTNELKPIMKNGKRGYECPQCREFTEEKDVKCNNLILKQILEVYSKIATTQEERLCSRCSKVPVKWKCMECSKEYCDTCRVPHDEFFTEHRVVLQNNDGNVVLDTPFYCDSHPSQKLELFCLNCKVAMCMTCPDTTHANHDKISVQRALHTIIPEIEGLVAEIQTRTKLLREQHRNAINSLAAKEREYEIAISALRHGHLEERKQLETSQNEEDQSLSEKQAELISERKLAIKAMKEKVAELDRTTIWAETVLGKSTGALQLMEIQSGLKEKLKHLATEQFPVMPQDDVKMETIPQNQPFEHILGEGAIPKVSHQLDRVSPASAYPVDCSKSTNNAEHNAAKFKSKPAVYDFIQAVQGRQLSLIKSFFVRDRPKPDGYDEFKILWNELWIPSNDKPLMQIYSLNGTWKRCMQLPGVLELSGFVQSGDNQVVVASTSGLFSMTKYGDGVRMISKGQYDLVCFSNDKLFACSGYTAHLVVFDNGPDWQHRGIISFATALNMESIYIYENILFAGYRDINDLLPLNINMETFQAQASRHMNLPKSWVRQVEGLQVHDGDAHGNLITCHLEGNFIAILNTRTRYWTKLEIEDDIDDPRCAHFENDYTMWVLHGENGNKLSKFCID